MALIIIVECTGLSKKNETSKRIVLIFFCFDNFMLPCLIKEHYQP